MFKKKLLATEKKNAKVSKRKLEVENLIESRQAFSVNCPDCNKQMLGKNPFEKIHFWYFLRQRSRVAHEVRKLPNTPAAQD